jgi:hypothetical protein
MDIIVKNINTELKEELIKIYEQNKHKFDTSLKKINAIILYTFKNKSKKYDYLFQILKNESALLTYFLLEHKLVCMQLVNNPVDCDDQYFHLDYQGDSFSFIIPVTEFNKLNGTKYLKFTNVFNYTKYSNLLLQLSNETLSDDIIVERLNEYGLIYSIDYTFEITTSKEFSIISLPDYIFHRGIKNKSTNIRVAYFFVFSLKNRYDYSFYSKDYEFIHNDLELDEDDESVNESVKYARQIYK